jgi:GDP-L-fucose synthase
MFKGERILITGGAGFIGANLAGRLNDAGAIVRATTHTQQPTKPIAGVEYISTDLRALAACQDVVKDMDYVFMCAANTQGAAVMTGTPMAHVTPNVVMNTHMLEASHQAGVKKFAFLSSGAAYPDTGARPVSEPEMLSGAPADVYFPVAWMKRYGEILCQTYSQHIDPPMPCVVIRPSNVYGPGDKFDPKTSHVTASLIRRVAERETPMEIWGTGDDVRDLIYIDDFVDGLLAAFARPKAYLEINICAGTGVSVKQILQTALDVDGFAEAEIRFDPTKPSTAPVRLFDGTLARDLLGFEPKVGLSEGLRRTIEWYRARIQD